MVGLSGAYCLWQVFGLPSGFDSTLSVLGKDMLEVVIDCEVHRPIRQ